MSSWCVQSLEILATDVEILTSRQRRLEIDRVGRLGRLQNGAKRWWRSFCIVRGVGVSVVRSVWRHRCMQRLCSRATTALTDL